MEPIAQDERARVDVEVATAASASPTRARRQDIQEKL